MTNQSVRASQLLDKNINKLIETLLCPSTPETPSPLLIRRDKKWLRFCKKVRPTLILSRKGIKCVCAVDFPRETKNGSSKRGFKLADSKWLKMMGSREIRSCWSYREVRGNQVWVSWVLLHSCNFEVNNSPQETRVTYTNREFWRREPGKHQFFTTFCFTFAHMILFQCSRTQFFKINHR